jgi:hypothetical protein
MMNLASWIHEMWLYPALIPVQAALAVLLHIPHRPKQLFVCCCVACRSETPFTKDAMSLHPLHSTDGYMPFSLRRSYCLLNNIGFSAVNSSEIWVWGTTARSVEQHTNHNHVSRNSFWFGSSFGTHDNDTRFLWPSSAMNPSVQVGWFESLYCWVDPWAHHVLQCTILRAEQHP